MIRHIPRKTKAILISILASLVLVGGTLGAFLIISNVLDLGVTELTAGQVRLTLLDALPAGVNPGEEMEARFRIENLGDIAITGASLKVRVFTTNDVALPSADIVTLEFESTDTFGQLVALSVVGDNLEGTMRADWLIPGNYVGEVIVKLTFTDQAPLAIYALSVWVESGAEGSGEGGGGNGGGGAAARVFTFDVGSKGDGFVAVLGSSGTGADGVDISGISPILWVLANEQVTVTLNWVSGKHNFAAYELECIEANAGCNPEDGWAGSGGWPGSVGDDVKEALPTFSVTFTAPAAGSLYYYCDSHPDDMLGTVEVFTP